MLMYLYGRPLKHALYTNLGGVCLFVRNLKEEEREKLEAKPGMNEVKIISMKQLKEEHATYDQRRKLVASYDVFLVDKVYVDWSRRISGACRTHVGKSHHCHPFK